MVIFGIICAIGLGIMTFSKDPMVRFGAWVALIGVCGVLSRFPEDSDNWTGYLLILLIVASANAMVSKDKDSKS